MNRFVPLACLIVLLCAFSGAVAQKSPTDLTKDSFEKKKVSPGEMKAELGNSTAELMDAKGNRTLKSIMEKDKFQHSVKNEAKEMRPRALKQTAKTLALQKAVQWRYQKIKEVLQKYEQKLNSIFNFSPLTMRGGKILPPVITEAKRSYRLESKKRASSVDAVYRIIKPAKMISNAPSWRTYLLKGYSSFSKEDVRARVLPQNKKERKIWKKAAVKGWKMGVKQANSLYQKNLHELVRDFKGILKFKTLEEQNMVSLPVVAQGEMGIQVQGKKLSVDKKIFRITSPSSFKESKEWTPKVKIQD